MDFPRITCLSELEEDPFWLDLHFLADPPKRCPTPNLPKKRQLDSQTTKGHPFSLDDRRVFSFYYHVLTTEEIWGKLVSKSEELQSFCKRILDDVSLAARLANKAPKIEFRDSLCKSLVILAACLAKGEATISPSQKSVLLSWFSFKSQSLALLSSLLSLLVRPLPFAQDEGYLSPTDLTFVTHTIFETSVSLLSKRWNLVAPPQCRPHTEEIWASIASIMTLPFLNEEIESDPNELTRKLLRSNCLSFCEQLLFKSLEYIPSPLSHVMKKVMDSPNRKDGMLFLNKACSPAIFPLGNVSRFVEQCCAQMPFKMVVFLPSLFQLKSDERAPIRRKLSQCHLSLIGSIPPRSFVPLHHCERSLVLDTDALVRVLGIKIISLHWLLYFQSETLSKDEPIIKAFIFSVSLIAKRIADKNEKVRIAAVTGAQILLSINPFGPNLVEEPKNLCLELKALHSEFRCKALEIFKTIYSLLSSPDLHHSDQFLDVTLSLFCGDSPPEIAKWVSQCKPPLKEKILSFLDSKSKIILKLNYRSLLLGAHSKKNASIVGLILKRTYMNEQNALGMSLVWIPLINRLDEQQFPLLERIFKFFLSNPQENPLHLDRMVPFYFEILSDPSECSRFPILRNEQTSDILLGTCNLLSLLASLFPSAMIGGIKTVLIPIIADLSQHVKEQSPLVKPILRVISSTLRYNSLEETRILEMELRSIFADNFRLFLEIDGRAFVDCLTMFEDGPARIQDFLHELEDELVSCDGDLDVFAVRFTSFVQMIGLSVNVKGKTISSWVKSQECEQMEQSDDALDYMSNHLKKITRESEFRRLCNESIYSGSLGRFVNFLEDLVKMDPSEGGLMWLQIVQVSALQALGVMTSWCTQLTERVSPLLYQLSCDSTRMNSTEHQQTAVVALCDLLNRDQVGCVGPKKIMSTLMKITENSRNDPKFRSRTLSLFAACLLGNLVPYENYLHHLAFYLSDPSDSVAFCSREALFTLFRQRVKGASTQGKMIYHMIHSLREHPGDIINKKKSLELLFSELLPRSQHGALSDLILQSIRIYPFDELLSFSISRIRPSLSSLQTLQNALEEISENLEKRHLSNILEHLDHARTCNDLKQFVAPLKEALQRRKVTGSKKKEQSHPLDCHHLMDIQEVGLGLE